MRTTTPIEFGKDENAVIAIYARYSKEEQSQLTNAITFELLP